MTTTSVEKPIFHYDLDIFNQIKYYLEEKNHHGLALIARQKGVPPFLRFKVWPILLKYHPFVLSPFIQPDLDGDEPVVNVASIQKSIHHDLRKYVQRLQFSTSNKPELDDIGKKMLETLSSAILKFAKKWGKIMKYDASLAWMALNLAEWLPPLDNTSWVLCGRDHSTRTHLIYTDIVDDYADYIGQIPGLGEFMEDMIKDPTLNMMSFYEVYERLVLVLLHCPDNVRSRGEINHEDIEQRQKSLLPLNGGTIEDRVAYFIYCFRKLLPELASYFSDEQILTRFGAHDDEWLIWWLKYAGSKVWSKFDRGRIWDMMLGWRVQNPKRTMQYYFEKLNISKEMLAKLGPDLFWSVRNDDGEEGDEFDEANVPTDSSSGTTNTTTSSLTRQMKNSSFRDLVKELNNKLTLDELYSSSPGSAVATDGKLTIPFSTLDPQFELLFVSLALLKSKENILIELDQHEIRQFLSRLPPKSFKYKKTEELVLPSSVSSTSSDSSGSLVSTSPGSGIYPMMIRNDFSVTDYKVDYMDNVINEAGDMWRKWMWMEMVDNR